MGYVYILKSLKDKNKYIGSTINLEKRLKLHNQGQVQSTRNRRPLVLVAYQEFSSIQEAAALEKKYKRSHGSLDRAIKKGDFVIISKSE